MGAELSPIGPGDYPRWLRVLLRVPLVGRLGRPYAARIDALPPVPSGDWVASSFSYDPGRRIRKRRVSVRNLRVRRPADDEERRNLRVNED